MRFVTILSALLILGYVSAEEYPVECAMYAEACESLCVVHIGGELAVPKCAAETSMCFCDGVDMSDYVNENAVKYINGLSDNDLVEFIDSSYKRVSLMKKKAVEESVNVAVPAEIGTENLEMSNMGAQEADSFKNQYFNLVLDDEQGTENDSEEGAEDEGSEDEGSEGEGNEEDSDEGDEDQDDNDIGEIEDEEESRSNKVKEESIRKPLERTQDLFCQTFVSRCKDDCSAAQSEVTCSLEDSATGYLLACACNGVDISSSVYAQVKAESRAVDV